MSEPRSVSLSARRFVLVSACAAAIAISTPAVHALGGRLQQPGQPPAVGAAVPPPNPISLGELNRLFEAYALIQAQDNLKLTDEQYPDFVARLKTLQDARRQHFNNRNRILSELGRALHAPEDQIDDKAVKSLNDSLEREDDTAQVEIKKAFENVTALLDVRQRARFRLFEENLERRKLDLLSRVQRPNRKPQPTPPAPTK